MSKIKCYLFIGNKPPPFKFFISINDTLILFNLDLGFGFAPSLPYFLHRACSEVAPNPDICSFEIILIMIPSLPLQQPYWLLSLLRWFLLLPFPSLNPMQSSRLKSSPNHCCNTTNVQAFMDFLFSLNAHSCF